MNKQLADYARKTLKEGLDKCTDSQVKLFKRMYSYNHMDRSISEAVDAMPEDKLDHAMSQVERTLRKGE